MQNHLLQTQTIRYTQAVAEIFYEVLHKRTALDRELKHYFRVHSECGSRDRFYISESCFSLFRWYGWLNACLPGGLPEKPEESQKWCQGLAAALWLEQHDQVPFFNMLLKRAQLNPEFITQTPDDIKGKQKILGRVFKIRKLAPQQLIPEWFIKSISSDINIEQLIETLQMRPPVWIRVQHNAYDRVIAELTKQNINFEQHAHVTQAIKITSPKFNATDLSCYNGGDIEIQDLGSQCIGLACGAQENQHWLDLCAGAGGKSLLLADQMNGTGSIVATDIREEVLDQLIKRAKRASFNNITTADAIDTCNGDQLFDGVLVDAPCSCTGVWRRNPDLKWTTPADACAMNATSQVDICTMATTKVKPGGVLIYGVCSITRQENEDVVELFLKKHSDFMLEAFINPINGRQTNGMCRIDFMPDDNDGMFVARMRRKG